MERTTDRCRLYFWDGFNIFTSSDSRHHSPSLILFSLGQKDRASQFMNDTDQIKMLVSTLAIQLPTLLVCFVAGVVILGRWREASRGAIWALLGFGLATILCIAIPVTQAVVQEWLKQSHWTIAERASVFAGLGFLWSVLRAISYALLLVAVFAGRSNSSSVSPPL